MVFLKLIKVTRGMLEFEIPESLHKKGKIPKKVSVDDEKITLVIVPIGIEIPKKDIKLIY